MGKGKSGRKNFIAAISYSLELILPKIIENLTIRELGKNKSSMFKIKWKMKFEDYLMEHRKWI